MRVMPVISVKSSLKPENFPSHLEALEDLFGGEKILKHHLTKGKSGYFLPRSMGGALYSHLHCPVTRDYIGPFSRFSSRMEMLEVNFKGPFTRQSGYRFLLRWEDEHAPDLAPVEVIFEIVADDREGEYCGVSGA